MFENLSDKHKFYLYLAGGLVTIVAVATLAAGAFKALALAFGLAYLMDPVVDYFEKRKVPRVLSVLVILLVIIGLLVLLLSLGIPYLWKQAVQFIREAPDLAEQALQKIGKWSILPEEMTRSVPELLEDLKNRLLSGGFATIKPLAAGIFQATSGAVGILLGIVHLVIIPVFFFFILKDIDGIRNGFYSFVPSSIRDQVQDYFRMIDGVLSGFIRGQIMVAVSLAVLYSIGLGITGIRFGVLIGVVAGLLFIVPYVGTFIGILASALVLIVDFSGWGQVMGVAATFAIAQAIEGYILTPRIVGNRVGLNQLETLVVILVGGEMGGLAGLIIAIPTGGILKKTIAFLQPDKEQVKGERDERLYMAGGQGEGLRVEGEEEEGA
jgi:predicted PurR-regulated permease PerM